MLPELYKKIQNPIGNKTLYRKMNFETKKHPVLHPIFSSFNLFRRNYLVNVSGGFKTQGRNKFSEELLEVTYSFLFA